MFNILMLSEVGVWVKLISDVSNRHPLTILDSCIGSLLGPAAVSPGIAVVRRIGHVYVALCYG